MKQVIINGSVFSFQEQETILMFLQRIGIAIPSLCHDNRLPAEAVCRTCLVKIKDISRLQPACRTVLTEEMEIETNTPEIAAYRKRIFELLLHDYPFF